MRSRASKSAPDAGFCDLREHADRRRAKRFGGRARSGGGKWLPEYTFRANSALCSQNDASGGPSRTRTGLAARALWIEETRS
jgi:hypothetical protein